MQFQVKRTRIFAVLEKKNGYKRVLIIVAHSDDETIGMAGTIRKHVLEGNTVNVVSMTNGVGSRDKVNQKSILFRKNLQMKPVKF